MSRKLKTSGVKKKKKGQKECSDFGRHALTIFCKV